MCPTCCFFRSVSVFGFIKAIYVLIMSVSCLLKMLDVFSMTVFCLLKVLEVFSMSIPCLLKEIYVLGISIFCLLKVLDVFSMTVSCVLLQMLDTTVCQYHVCSKRVMYSVCQYLYAQHDLNPQYVGILYAQSV